MKATTWGKLGMGTITVRGEVGRSIERRTGLSICGGPRLDSTTDESRIYQATLGRPLRTGGYSVEGEIWWSEPRGES